MRGHAGYLQVAYGVSERREIPRGKHLAAFPFLTHDPITAAPSAYSLPTLSTLSGEIPVAISFLDMHPEAVLCLTHTPWDRVG